MIQIPYQNELVPAWTAQEIMRQFKITKMTLNRWQNEGLPVVRMGRAVFYPVHESTSWVTLNKVDVPYGRKDKYKYLY